ncbi:sugar transporter protein [Penicillium malachiteum]|uniref:sugar transporter protein n=1 Tax=Penicillium malachiteum TaxID=1324776 RepID=UPI0025471D53|nr:sugar transporter protein [Penicillium malachiteum]KAJ5737205.1 sugar transporter protein [Penicillium malachiteum]
MVLPKIYNVYFLADRWFGFDISSMSLVIGTTQYTTYFDNPDTIRQDGITASMAGGSVIGALVVGPISNRLGRRDSILFACIWWLIGTTIQVACNGEAMLIVDRLLNGFCKEYRGIILCIQQWAIEWGIFVMYFISYGWSFYHGKPTGAFRGAWAMQYIPCIMLMIGLPFLPRSPRWLAKVGRKEEVISVLANIQAKGDREDPLVIAEWEEITTILAAERESPIKGWRLFFTNGMWKRTFAGTSMQAWQQLSGANVMTYYILYVFEMAGLSGNVDLTSSGVEYAVFIIGTAMTFFFIDNTGRRPLLIYGTMAMSTCMFIVGGILATYGTYLPDGLDGDLSVRIKVTGAPSYVVIVFSYVLVLAYSLTLAPIAWVYVAEVWSLETRATGMALASVSNWLSNFGIGFMIPAGFANITYKLFIIFGILSFASSVQAFFTYPETAGKTIEGIEKLFEPGATAP